MNAGNVSSISSKGTTIQGDLRTEVRYPDSSATAAKLFVTEISEFAGSKQLLTLLQSKHVTVNATTPSSGTSVFAFVRHDLPRGGRRMSRTGARKQITGAELRRRLEAEGIVVRCPSNRGLAEEAPFAYKDVERVVAVVEQAGLAGQVAQLLPLGVVKG